MQVTNGTWRMREQCVLGSLSSSPAQEPGNEARVSQEGLSVTCEMPGMSVIVQLKGRLAELEEEGQWEG